MVDELQQLKKDIALNQVVIFIGSTVSSYTTNGEETTSHWKRLLKHGIQYCYQLGCINDQIFEDFVKTLKNNTNDIDDYLLIADQIKQCLNNDAGDFYKQWLRETVGQLSIQRPALIQAIGELRCPILTTNYDLFIEKILNRKTLIWNTYNDESDKNLQNSILHLYGCYDNTDSFVFSRYDYDRFLKDECLQLKLKSLIENKTLLLIGYDNGMNDPHLSYLFKFISHIQTDKSLSIYKLVSSNKNQHARLLSNISYLENIKEISYGNTYEDLLSFVINLRSFQSLIHHQNLSFTEKKEQIRQKYLHYLLNEYGHVSIFGYSNTNMNLPLESVYVELKFDPTHPSIKAMKTLEINEEFKRKLLSPTFFTDKEMRQLNQALIERNTFNLDAISRDFMIDQWVNVLLNNRNIFTDNEATQIKNKINRLKRNIIEKNNLKETKQYKIEEAYNEFKHFLILGHPGSGKTTLSKWLVTNMAKQCLCQTNMLFNSHSSSSFLKEKIPILIPIWKYVDQIKQNGHQQKKSLLEFIYENPTFNSTYFTNEEQHMLSLVIMESLIEGNVLVIFEGLDEVPMYADRNDLMKEINLLLEHSIDYDIKSNKLCYSRYEHKEINNTKNPLVGNRFIITSRIEGNYFEDINFFIPRLTIENMSNDALKLFCSSYIECIQKISVKQGKIIKQYQPDQLYNEITLNKDIFQLAINPQLASVIAAIYTQYDDKLPEKRIDLYDIAIQMMIQRLLTHYINEEYRLNDRMIWSILEQIAEYLHSKVEGLSEDVLKYLIKRSLINHQQLSSENVDDLVLKLVDMFKYQVGLLNEYGHDSFRFIHRTFQEYLAAKSIIYKNGILRSEEMIYGNMMTKIDIPNWRVPLSMTFGILTKSSQHTDLFNNIVNSLLTNEQSSFNTQFSTSLTPFVIIDSLNDMYFSSQTLEYELLEKLSDMLLVDYKNLSGFARLKQHQQLIHSYFSKLKLKYENILAKWFLEKMTNEENLAPCANIIYELKWYHTKFHEIFLNNLHHDSMIWNWSIDSILRFYSAENNQGRVSNLLIFKNILERDPQMIYRIKKNNAWWLPLITALYGGYKNYNTPATISEYYEIAQFLGLSENQRLPFTFYYQDTWGREDPAYRMAVHLDTVLPKDDWKKKPIFDLYEFYKESFLTTEIIKLIQKEKSPECLRDELRIQINNRNTNINEKIEASIALIALGDFDFLHVIVKQGGSEFLKYFEKRIDQLIYTFKDPIARYSSSVNEYLIKIYNDLKSNQLKFNIHFSDYCKIYLSLVASSGGSPVDVAMLFKTMDNIEDKCSLYAEYLAVILTGAADDFRYKIAVLADQYASEDAPKQFIKSFIKISDAVQIYRPIQTYPWPLDIFTFQLNNEDDIPITFFNCLENMSCNIPYIIDCISILLRKQGYFTKNSELIPLVVLLHFGIMSVDLDRFKVYEKLLPELVDQSNMKEFLFENIQSMSNPYYKSRALYQLAQFYDQKSYELLNESFLLTGNILEPVLKFQVLEKIFNVIHYKEVEQKSFIYDIINELILTYDSIEDIYDQVIASIRLSFYGSEKFRKKYLTNALDSLSQMAESDQKIKLIIKLKPLVQLYDDLQIKFDEIIENIQNKTWNYWANSYYGRILFTEQLPIQILDRNLDRKRKRKNIDREQQPKNALDYTELQALFLLFAQLNDIKSLINRTESLDQLWMNLFKDPDNQENIEKILNIGLKNELFLTPPVAIIFDELIRNGKEDLISILFPYIIKPSHEVLPTVHRWFTDYHGTSIKNLAALLLVEAKYIYEAAVDPITDLLNSDNDQMRYRAQRVFQHPDRDVTEPSKRISVIGEKTLMKILSNLSTKEHLPRVRNYIVSFFYDVLWDDPIVFQHLYSNMIQLNEINSNHRKVYLFNKIKFINDHTWNALIQSLESINHPSYIEELLQSIMHLVKFNQITPENWLEFVRILSITDTSQFENQFYFLHTYVEIVNFIINEICTLTAVHDETYFGIFELKLIHERTIQVENLIHSNYQQIQHITSCNFYIQNNLNQTILDLLNVISIDSIIMENLIQWLIQKMTSFTGAHDSLYTLMICDGLLSLVSACIQKDDYLYRKIVNSHKFNKFQMIKLLEKILHHYPYFMARGNAFILLSAMDNPDHRVIVNGMNTLFDENLVKEYSMIGMPLIHLLPNGFLDNLLESLNNPSAIKAYEILKIFTEFALNEKIDGNSKSKIINYLTNEIKELKSKKPVNYYYTDIKIPFTTTLENELYKAWIKIQGLSGKTQYSIDVKQSK